MLFKSSLSFSSCLSRLSLRRLLVPQVKGVTILCFFRPAIPDTVVFSFSGSTVCPAAAAALVVVLVNILISLLIGVAAEVGQASCQSFSASDCETGRQQQGGVYSQVISRGYKVRKQKRGTRR